MALASAVRILHVVVAQDVLWRFAMLTASGINNNRRCFSRYLEASVPEIAGSGSIEGESVLGNVQPPDLTSGQVISGSSTAHRWRA